MSRRLVVCVFVAFVAGALALSACGGDGAGDATTDLAVTGTDALKFEPDAYTIPAGELVTLRFTAEESVDHDFVIEDAGDVGMVEDDDMAEDEHGAHGDHDDHAAGGDLHVAHADPGMTVTSMFMINEPGTYTVFCTVPGHREAGMEATLTVVDDG
jgi:uncharacterized cupredoxin-like copper-binding protein